MGFFLCFGEGERVYSHGVSLEFHFCVCLGGELCACFYMYDFVGFNNVMHQFCST